jgi:cellobiose phosphorylase
MNRFGEHGAGESVWLGRFLHAALSNFAPLADRRHETEGDVLWLDPCIPKARPGFEVRLKFRTASDQIRLDNSAGVERGVASAVVDGTDLPGSPVQVHMVDDGAIHHVILKLGSPQ